MCHPGQEIVDEISPALYKENICMVSIAAQHIYLHISQSEAVLFDEDGGQAEEIPEKLVNGPAQDEIASAG
jgi:hypothetical protein